MSFILPSISLYIHFPFCIKKCYYCDFNSHKLRKYNFEKYIELIQNEIEKKIKYLQGRRICSIFIGGGTPSLLSIDLYIKIFNFLFNKKLIQNSLEITMEINPDASEDYIKDIGNYTPINRLSFGIQTTNENILKTIGRTHKKYQILNIIEIIKKINIKNINFDLIYGLPNQTLNDLIDDINFCVNSTVSHISFYELSIEKNTLFYIKRPNNLPKESLLNKMEKVAKKILKNHDFYQYEISAFSKRKHICIHNMNYWKFNDYIGVGPGAHSKITIKNKNKFIRMSNIKNPFLYLKNNYNAFKLNLTKKDLISEFMINRLRINKPFHINQIEKKTNIKFNDVKKYFDKCIEKKFLNIISNKVYLTKLGKNYINDIISLFL